MTVIHNFNVIKKENYSSVDILSSTEWRQRPKIKIEVLIFLFGGEKKSHNVFEGFAFAL